MDPALNHQGTAIDDSIGVGCFVFTRALSERFCSCMAIPEHSEPGFCIAGLFNHISSSVWSILDLVSVPLLNNELLRLQIISVHP